MKTSSFCTFCGTHDFTAGRTEQPMAMLRTNVHKRSYGDCPASVWAVHCNAMKKRWLETAQWQEHCSTYVYKSEWATVRTSWKREKGGKPSRTFPPPRLPSLASEEVAQRILSRLRVRRDPFQIATSPWGVLVRKRRSCVCRVPSRGGRFIVAMNFFKNKLCSTSSSELECLTAESRSTGSGSPFGSTMSECDYFFSPSTLLSSSSSASSSSDEEVHDLLSVAFCRMYASCGTVVDDSLLFCSCGGWQIHFLCLLRLCVGTEGCLTIGKSSLQCNFTKAPSCNNPQ